MNFCYSTLKIYWLANNNDEGLMDLIITKKHKLMIIISTNYRLLLL